MREEQVENVTDKTNVPSHSCSHLVLSRQECKPGIRNEATTQGPNLQSSLQDIHVPSSTPTLYCIMQPEEPFLGKSAQFESN